MNNFAFGNFICKLREDRKLSQTELGKILGISNKAISKWENGETMPRSSMLPRLAESLHVSVDTLLSCCESPIASENIGLSEQLKKILQTDLQWRLIYAVIAIAISLISTVPYLIYACLTDISSMWELALIILYTFLGAGGTISVIFALYDFLREKTITTKIIIISLALLFSWLLLPIGAIIFVPYYIYNVVQLKKQRTAIMELISNNRNRKKIATGVVALILAVFTITMILFLITHDFYYNEPRTMSLTRNTFLMDDELTDVISLDDSYQLNVYFRQNEGSNGSIGFALFKTKTENENMKYKFIDQTGYLYPDSIFESDGTRYYKEIYYVDGTIGKEYISLEKWDSMDISKVRSLYFCLIPENSAIQPVAENEEIRTTQITIGGFRFNLYTFFSDTFAYE